MKEKQAVASSRFYTVDALRGFALTGILLLHAVEHFDLLLYPEAQKGMLAYWDNFIKTGLFFLFAGKAYSIFSLLFGLSFYLQWQKHKASGGSFHLTFAWRLLILLAFGYLLSLVYIGEILSDYALLGFLLMLLNLLPNRWLLIVAFLSVIQIPTLFLLRFSFIHASYTFQQDWSAWQEVFSTFSTGSFADVVRFNLWKGHLAKWQFYLNSGRYLQFFALFALGILLGRVNYFGRLKDFLVPTRIVALVSFVVFLFCFGFPLMESVKFSKSQHDLIALLCEQYASISLAAFLFTMFILLVEEWGIDDKPSWLAAYGKMSLTHYTLQALIGVPLFYGFGFGLYQKLGVTYSFFLGLGLLALQLLFSIYWLKRFQYGPLEGCWRALTYRDASLVFKRK